jgi:very-short-patch-repair endonuclease
MSDVLRVVGAKRGVCTAADLREAGLSRRAIAVAVERGMVERLRRGVFADPGLPEPLKRAVRVGGRLACVSAARLHGLRVLNHPDVLHVGVDPRATRLRHPDDATRRLRPGQDPAGVRLHWTSTAGDGPLASLEECLLQLIACLPELDALCTLDSAREHVDWLPERAPLLDDAAFGRLLERATPTARRIALRSVTGSQAVGETVARERLRAAEIPVRPQVRLPGGYWADLLIGERLVFDIDGEGPHTAPGAFDRDRARIGWLKAIGYSYLSYSHTQVLQEWASIETVIRMLMRRGEHRWADTREH